MASLTWSIKLNNLKGCRDMIKNKKLQKMTKKPKNKTIKTE